MDSNQGIDKNTIPHWYVAYTRTNQERRAAEKLASMGIESFVPVRKEKRKWSDRTKIVDVLLIPGRIFVRCTEAKRIEVLQRVAQIFAFMNDRGPFKPVIVPDRQLSDFKAIVEAYDTTIDFVEAAVGDRVRIVGGQLAGLEGILVKKGNLNTFAIEIESIGYATVNVCIDYVERILD